MTDSPTLQVKTFSSVTHLNFKVVIPLLPSTSSSWVAHFAFPTLRRPLRICLALCPIIVQVIIWNIWIQESSSLEGTWQQNTTNEIVKPNLAHLQFPIKKNLYALRCNHSHMAAWSLWGMRHPGDSALVLVPGNRDWISQWKGQWLDRPCCLGVCVSQWTDIEHTFLPPGGDCAALMLSVSEDDRHQLVRTLCLEFSVSLHHEFHLYIKI